MHLKERKREFPARLGYGKITIKLGPDRHPPTPLPLSPPLCGERGECPRLGRRAYDSELFASDRGILPLSPYPLSP